MDITRVIIFEDEFILANDLKRQISRYGYDVLAMFKKAEDGIEWLESAEARNEIPDVVLMDISLAGKMTGIEAAGIISAKYSCAIVFLTGMSQLEVFEEAFKSKPSAFLLKPFDIQQALISIRLSVYMKKLENQLRASKDELEVKVLERTRELNQAKEGAEYAVRMKNTVLANVSHQIREPMYGILGLTAMMKEETKDRPLLQRYTQYIEENAKHLFALLNKILELNYDTTANPHPSGSSDPRG
jgi:DNA-binding NtrC family response regulator